MTQAEYDRWLPEAMVGYAEDMIGSGVDSETAHAKSARDFPTFLPNGLATEGQLLYTVVADGGAVGVLWLTERDVDMGRSLFILDVQIDEEQRGRGLGRAAMLLVEEEARRRGLERVTLNVFGGNDVARNLYRSLGYRETAVYMMKRV
jgi:ribosomal protein S18 acetylase RimI-like enzyme